MQEKIGDPQPQPAAVAAGGVEPTIVKRPGSGRVLAPGVVLGHTYVVEELLARGGMGEVYRARHLELGTRHAIKVILPSLSSDPKMVQLLVEEARKLARVRHDAIVGYEGLFREEGDLRYLVMEFVDGESLTAILARRRLEPEEVLRLRDRLAAGLAAAHEKGVIHRDISPDNIILPGGEVDRAKVIDFGIAKSARPGDPTLIGSDFAGKYSFVSPEQAGLYGGQVDGRSDIYSLGLVLAAAALGRKLDMGSSPSTVIAARQSIPDLSEIPLSLRPLIASLLAPRPQDRPPSMRALLPAPTQYGERPPPERGSPKRKAALLAGLAVLALALIVAVFFFRGAIWPPSAAGVRAALANATSGYRCARLDTTLAADRSARVSGHLPTSADLERLRAAVMGIPGIGTVAFDVRLMAWPYCQVVDLLQPLSSRQRKDGARIALATKAAYSGERLALAVRVPRFDSFLYIDYYDIKGEVLHLLPNDRDRFNLRPARNRFLLGKPPLKTCWNLGGSTGEQLVTFIAVQKPLFRTRRPQTESVRDYLESLKTALSRQREASAVTLFFDLKKAPYPNPAAACPAA